ncbi:MAG: glutamate synthase large subunit, partial [Gemmatimonadota bacterium]|nr:glutamate synthase large subunit [Gemmatimonadota bacterium]
MSEIKIKARRGLYLPEFEHDCCGVGFVARIDGRPSHGIIRQGIEVLVNLAHRGAVADDPETGDGAGIMIQVCDRFLRAACAEAGIDLPGSGQYGVGMVFLPVEKAARQYCTKALEEAVAGAGQKLIGWREVPVNPDCLGRSARLSQPLVRQIFIADTTGDRQAFERRLLLVRKIAENRIRKSGPSGSESFHLPSLSSRTIVYKGLMLAHQVPLFYEDLNDERLTSALALVHQRYSTNTFPSWELAQPFHYLAHNGEINTLRGNINWMRAREATISSPLFGDKIKQLLPIITPGGSDSMALDNMVEMLSACGRSLPHTLMMLIPEAWGEKYQMSQDKRGFYEYHSILMEPWDGPAAIAFTDGEIIGGCLDRNGLRPARYVVTDDDLIVMASEVGVLDFPPEKIKSKGRIGPGQMLLVDTRQKRIIYDPEIKAVTSRLQPYRRWVAENKIDLRGLFDCALPLRPEHETLIQRQIACGYTDEDISVILRPMAEKAIEPVGSMGNDTPPAVLSDQPKLLYNYFKQLFAQVTNPAIDPIREQLVMSLMSYIGNEANLLKETPKNARLLKLTRPILTHDDLDKLKSDQHLNFRTRTVPILFPVEDGAQGCRRALERCFTEAVGAAREGCALIILSDRGINREMAAIPSLLALSAVHHHLIREGLRTNIGLVIESSEAREVMHFALLLGFGSSAIIPYLAFESIADLVINDKLQAGINVQQAIENYLAAIEKGLLKVFSKMGISTVRSYRGAQIFEAIGLDHELIDKYFPGTVSRIGGAGLDEIVEEALSRHRHAFPERQAGSLLLPRAGEYSFRKGAEQHAWNPETIVSLQEAARRGDKVSYDRFAALANDHSRSLQNLRSLFEFRKAKPVPLEEVEPAGSIMKRFVTGAMSFGSINREVHETIAIAMNRIGGKSNSGEGGEDEARYELRANGDDPRSAIKQVASGRFGVTSHYLANSDDMQIKIAQGSKPGEGGQLPGFKVDENIARVRHSVPGVTLISPPPHHDIYSIEDLAQLIYDLKNVNPQARVSVKLVAEIGVGTVAAGVAKARADLVLISGASGGTGASPLSSIKHAG